jgi:hypothetical protein
MRQRLSYILFIVMLCVPGSVAAGNSESTASANASGEGVIVTGPNPYNFESTKPINGTISIIVNNTGDRGSPLQNVDEVTVEAKFSTAESDYEVRITEPMINHINGKDPTWFGVVYKQKMHGDTKTVTSKLPEMEPDIALWGWAEVYKNGELIGKRVPSHVKAMRTFPLKGVTLQVGVEGQPLPNTPDGYLHIHWPQIDHLVLPEKQKKTREWIGWGGLILLNLWFGWLAVREPLLENKPKTKL